MTERVLLLPVAAAPTASATTVIPRRPAVGDAEVVAAHVVGRIRDALERRVAGVADALRGVTPVHRAMYQFAGDCRACTEGRAGSEAAEDAGADAWALG